MPALSTPCTKLCLLDRASGLCEGCGRTAGEIARWGAMSEAERLGIMAGLAARLQARRETLREAAAPGPARGRS